jgi:ABC-type Fe3+/spermidine/putrescine transport system ATPase subunit
MPTVAQTVRIRLRQVCKQFLVRGKAVEAVAGVDLDIEAGEFLCIVGLSGCGKTTLLRIVAGLESKSGGTIEIARDAGSTTSAGERPLNSMVFQEMSIFPWMMQNAAMRAEVIRARKGACPACHKGMQTIMTHEEPRMRLKHEFVNGQVYLWPGYELAIGDELREELDGRLYVWTRWR